ncbi:hypothetical protein TELCIR_22676, partial [Teladorsagia circumcincta]
EFHTRYFRLCAFIPKIAAANDSLTRGESDGTRKLDVDIHKVSLDLDESDTSSSDESSSSDDDLDSDTEPDPKVEFDLSLFREDDSIASAAASEPSLIPQEVDLLPEAFRECDSTKCDEQNTNKSKTLIEEI